MTHLFHDLEAVRDLDDILRQELAPLVQGAVRNVLSVDNRNCEFVICVFKTYACAAPPPSAGVLSV